MTSLQRLISLGLTPQTSKMMSGLPEITIEQLEASLGERIPAECREVVAFGGGLFPVDTFYFDNHEKEPIQLGWFMTPGESFQARDDLEYAIERNLLPIADDGGQNMLCIALSGPERGRIYFHDHSVATLDRDALHLPPTSSHLVANSFEELVRSITQESP